MKKGKRKEPRSSALFAAIAILLPLLALGALEGALRLGGYGHDLSLFVPAPPGAFDRETLLVNPEVARRYFTDDRFVPRPLRDGFARQKPERGLRLFVMGESTSAGFPYAPNVAFSRMLQGRLAEALPGREVEVVNVAVTATNSYTLLDFIDEVLAQQPDAVLIYAGHNEFYGALGAASTVSIGRSRPLVLAWLKLHRLKLMQLLEQAVHRARRMGAAQRSEAPGEGGAALTLMGRMIGETSIAEDSPAFALAREQFEANLRALYAKAKAAGIPILAGELVSNLRDQAPFSGADAGRAFGEAREHEAAGRIAEAQAAYLRAKDLDALRFRAPEQFNEILRRVADESGLPVVPLREAFARASPRGLVGFNLMLEHLHPNVEGQALMSEAFLGALHRHGMVAAPAAPRAQWPVSEFDRALGALRIRRMTDFWPFKPPAESGKQTAQYRPEGFLDSLVYGVATNRTRLAEARLELARAYHAQGRDAAALLEYRALSASAPWDYQVQLAVARGLIDAGRAAEALPFLEASRRLKDTPLARDWISRIRGRV